MPRPQKHRKVCYPPMMKGFKPFGMPFSKLENVSLTYDEYESLRLVNYDMQSQEQAAVRMNVSRPTFTRIYNKALKAITLAFVEGKAIVIEGGNYLFEKDWYRCKKCYRLIEGIENHNRCNGCLQYDSNELIKLNKK